MTSVAINSDRLISRIRELGSVGRDASGQLTRLAASDADKAGRDLLVSWMMSAGMEVRIDQVGNIFGLWSDAVHPDQKPLMLGSHIDTVINAGIYDGCYGVLGALEVIETLIERGKPLARPIVVAAFTNEEGVRYAPDMLGSLVYAGGLGVEEALDTIGTDGSTLGAELKRIGYLGTDMPGFMPPHAYIELHIEQGPVLEREGIAVGAVENLQGISWQRITVAGTANHAGTTPMSMRADAGFVAASVVTFLRMRTRQSNAAMVATVGCMEFKPNAINVIPSRVTFTVDLRDPDEQRLLNEEAALARYLEDLAAAEHVTITVERLARFEPVTFDRGLVESIERAASARGLSCRRMTSGAGHDAQMMARLAPSAMIFVPSIGGISHNPEELTLDADLLAGANVFLDVVLAHVS